MLESYLIYGQQMRPSDVASAYLFSPFVFYSVFFEHLFFGWKRNFAAPVFQAQSSLSFQNGLIIQIEFLTPKLFL